MITNPPGVAVARVGATNPPGERELAYDAMSPAATKEPLAGNHRPPCAQCRSSRRRIPDNAAGQSFRPESSSCFARLMD